MVRQLRRQRRLRRWLQVQAVGRQARRLAMVLPARIANARTQLAIDTESALDGILVVVPRTANQLGAPELVA